MLWYTLHPSSSALPHLFSRITIRTDQPWPPVLQGYRQVVARDPSDLLTSTRPAPRWWWFPSSSCLSLAPLRATSSPLDRLVHISNHQFVKITHILPFYPTTEYTLIILPYWPEYKTIFFEKLHLKDMYVLTTTDGECTCSYRVSLLH